MTTFKKILATLLCISCVAFAGCGNTKNNKDTSNTSDISMTEQIIEGENKEPSGTPTPPKQEEITVHSSDEKDNETTDVPDETGADASDNETTDVSNTDISLDGEDSNTDTSAEGSDKTSEISKDESSAIEDSDDEHEEHSDEPEISTQKETSKPAESSKNNDVSYPKETSKPAEQSKPTETSKPTEQSKPVESSKPAETSKPTETSKPAEQSKPIEQPKPTVVNVTSVSLNKSSITLTVGENSKLSATVNPSNATNKTVTWSSSNNGVATVDQSGNVSAKSAGTATITVKSNNGKTASCSVTVKAKSTPKIKVTSFKLKDEGCTAALDNNCQAYCCPEVSPVGADISDLKITYTNNTGNLLTFDRIEKDSVQPAHGRSERYTIYFKYKKPTQDTKVTVTVTCGGFSSSKNYIVRSDFDARYANYYPPFTQEKLDAIKQDMFNYGFSKGFHKDDNKWLKWEGNKHYENSSFNFPVSTEMNFSYGMAFHDELMQSIDDMYDSICRLNRENIDPKLIGFNIHIHKTTGAMGQDVWDFYVLY